MSDWSKNNRAHALTWYSLYVLDQLKTGFVDSEELTVGDLTFWGALSSNDMKRLQANTLGINLDNMFRMIFNAELEDDVAREDAISAMQEALRSAETTLPELAAIADENYAFLGEPRNV
jgi:hypothetical protein